MSTNRTKKRKRRRPHIGADELDYLITGHTLTGEFPFESEECCRGAWEDAREWIMAQTGHGEIPEAGFFSHKGIPWGERPFAWWKYDSPQKRKMLKGDPGLIIQDGEFFRGEPRRYHEGPQKPNFPIFETEFSFLKRLKLLLPGEEKGYLKAEKERETLSKGPLTDDNDPLTTITEVKKYGRR